MKRRIWTPEDDEMVRDGYASKEMVHVIAAKLGITRNAVIGRARRLGLCVAGRQYYKSPEGIASLSEKKHLWHIANPEKSSYVVQRMNDARKAKQNGKSSSHGKAEM